jgi:4-hydroxy-4-methyl-2-oxoglutarate aldolase
MTDLFARLGEVPLVTTANVSDVLGSMGVMHPDIRTVVPGRRMVGRAFTVKAYPGSIITVHKALHEALAGAVLVVDGEGDVGAGALLGEIMALECRTKGFVGCVIDGSIRDVDGLLELGYPVFARGVTPRVGTNRRLGQTGVPVSCGGIVVHPGDIVLGDDNGVVVIPQEKEEGMAAALDLLLTKEQGLIEGIKKGIFLAERLGFKENFVG